MIDKIFNINVRGYRKMKQYTPRQLAELGLIPNPRGSKNLSSNYQYILRMIKTGQLEAIIINPDMKKSHFIVTKQAVKDFLKK